MQNTKLSSTHILWAAVLLGALALIPLVTGSLSSSLSTNLAARETLAALLRDHPPAVRPAVLAAAGCRGDWFQGLLAQASGDASQKQQAWAAAIKCSPDSILLLRAADPTNRQLAVAAVEAHPLVGDGWLWLADLAAEVSPEEAVKYYRTGLELKPSDGRGWVALARLLEPDSPVEAIEAYRQACHHGDPGLHGCYGVGRLSEALGEYETALAYYHRSRLEKSAALAASLTERLENND
ncbi:MAG: hypothetical protein R3335_01815 [Anaerolineales bacterium]|nr:hypothetical protein [Anaerolineales bacterium]